MDKSSEKIATGFGFVYSLKKPQGIAPQNEPSSKLIRAVSPLKTIPSKISNKENPSCMHTIPEESPVSKHSSVKNPSPSPRILQNPAIFPFTMRPQNALQPQNPNAPSPALSRPSLLKRKDMTPHEKSHKILIELIRPDKVATPTSVEKLKCLPKAFEKSIIDHLVINRENNLMKSVSKGILACPKLPDFELKILLAEGSSKEFFEGFLKQIEAKCEQVYEGFFLNVTKLFFNRVKEVHCDHFEQFEAKKNLKRESYNRALDTLQLAVDKVSARLYDKDCSTFVEITNKKLDKYLQNLNSAQQHLNSIQGVFSKLFTMKTSINRLDLPESPGSKSNDIELLINSKVTSNQIIQMLTSYKSAVLAYNSLQSKISYKERRVFECYSKHIYIPSLKFPFFHNINT